MDTYKKYYILMRHSVHRVKVMVEKVPEFSAESLCLRQGMVTNGTFIGTGVTIKNTF